MKKTTILTLALLLTGCGNLGVRNSGSTGWLLRHADDTQELFLAEDTYSHVPTTDSVLNREDQIINAYKDGQASAGGGWFDSLNKLIRGGEAVAGGKHRGGRRVLVKGQAAVKMAERFNPEDMFQDIEKGVKVSRTEDLQTFRSNDVQVAIEALKTAGLEEANKRLMDQIARLEVEMLSLRGDQFEQRQMYEARIDELIGQIKAPPAVIDPNPAPPAPSPDPEPTGVSTTLGTFRVPFGGARHEEGCSLWKHESEKDGGLVVLVLPPADWLQVTQSNGAVSFLDRDPEYDNPCEVDGIPYDRVHFRYPASGSAFGNDVTVRWGTGDRPPPNSDPILVPPASEETEGGF